jgi:hypothetical protein
MQSAALRLRRPFASPGASQGTKTRVRTPSGIPARPPSWVVVIPNFSSTMELGTGAGYPPGHARLV